MSKGILLIFLAAYTAVAICEKAWWQKSVVYQIYPRSFKDSDGDGIGDLNGITQSLWHMKDIGVNAIWLSPIYKSPMYDFGYDISDFKEIQPEYGTMNDFENLVKEAKRLGIHVLLDFVPNHSSNESVWFNLSANRTKGYENYFVWADGKPDPNNPGKLLPPSNWRSIFRGSAWEYNSKRGQFYLHQFLIGQPDLNYREPLIVQEIENIIRFWMDKGISGFRIDAVPHLFEVDPKDFGGQYPDEPRSNKLNASSEEWGYLDHVYTFQRDEDYDTIFRWREILDEYERKDGVPRFMLIEAYLEIKTQMKYYGNATHEGAHAPFNFEISNNINNDSDVRDLKSRIDLWLTYMPEGRTANWVNGNHDTSRMATKYGVERADMMNMLAILLPGITITYQGEELAMTDGEVTWEQTKDPAACNTHDPINYYKASRDPARTPFQWDDSKNAGFSTGNETWLPVASNYKVLNLKAQMTAAKSHYKFYRDLIILKKTKTVIDGDYSLKIVADSVMALLRYLPNEPIVLGVINFSPVQKTINMVDFFRVLPTNLKVYASGMYSKAQKGDIIISAKTVIGPYDTVVFTT